MIAGSLTIQMRKPDSDLATQSSAEADTAKQKITFPTPISETVQLEPKKGILAGSALQPAGTAMLEKADKLYLANGDAKAALPWYQQAAREGNPAAKVVLAYFTLKGLGGLIPAAEIAQKLAQEALPELQKLADEGNPNAQTRLGTLYREGLGVSKDEQMAVVWYRKAAEQKLPLAQFLLGVMHQEGRGVHKDEQQAVAWYRKAAEQGDAYAQNHLGSMYERGLGVSKDFKEAEAWYRKAADQGDAKAQNYLGWMYDQGHGVSQDSKEAVAWYRKAAEQGVLAAKIHLEQWSELPGLKPVVSVPQPATPEITSIAESDEIRKINEKKALCEQVDLAQAVKREDPVRGAQLAIRRYWYIRGKYGFPNFIGVIAQQAKDTIPELQALADKGNSGAQLALATLYSIGLGTVPDENKAKQLREEASKKGDVPYYFWLPKSTSNPSMVQDANRGDPAAQLVVGQHLLSAAYLSPKSVDSNTLQTGVEWLNESANQGCRTAQLQLGAIFDEGKIVSRNTSKAIKWYTEAAKMGDVTAQTKLAKIHKSEEGISKDERQSATWYRVAADNLENQAQILLGPNHIVASSSPDSEWADAAVFLAVGDNYEQGRGVERSDEEAAKWYLKAAKQLNSEAQFRLGLMYQQGRGVEKDLHQAWQWLIKAAVKHHMEAKNTLSHPDMKALQSTLLPEIDKLANSGNADAQFELASIYYLQPKFNFDSGLYRSAADAGNWDAQHILHLTNLTQIYDSLDPAEKQKFLPFMQQMHFSYTGD